jgi:superfamily II DNA or RNA helicase
MAKQSTSEYASEEEEQGLRSLSLEISYRSGREDLLEDFYIPCLQHADRYDRAAGYFDSKSLVLAAQGISELVLNEGKMRLIVSPRLTAEDIEVLRQVSKAEDKEEGDVDLDRDDIIETALHRGLTNEQFEDYLNRDRFKCLAWMLEEELLEIRIAYMGGGDGINPFSHYHEKIGIFSDDFENKVAFSGSINETELAWTDNYESFDVYTNWWPGMDLRTSDKQESFDTLWNNEDPRVTVKELPDAVRSGLKEHSPETVDGRPDLELFHRDNDDGGDEDEIPLWEHQKQAVDEWIANDYRGIFAMATGTGKTRAAIAAANLGANQRLTVIAVPTTTLLNQWKEDIEELIDDVDILVCSGETNWREEMLSLVNPYRIDDGELIEQRPKKVLLTTIHTAVGDTFRSFLSGVPPNRLQVVADEVHRYGADTFSQLFELDAGRRIGLSATPERKYDEQGNRDIIEYFEDVIFRFETAEAIENGYLSKYEYHPLICELDDEEFERYVHYSRQIGQAINDLNSDNPSKSVYELRERRDKLRRDRAKVLKKAKAKPPRFGEFLKTNHPTPAIIFCEDNEQVDEIQAQLDNHDKEYAVFVSDMDDDKKASSFYKFNHGTIDYLLAINCLDEGVDVPDCPTAIIIASSSNERQFIQRRGRVLRKSENKPQASVYDMITLPGLLEERGDETAHRFIKKELDRSRVLMDAADNQEDVRQQLRTQFEPYGFGHLALI